MKFHRAVTRNFLLSSASAPEEAESNPGDGGVGSVGVVGVVDWLERPNRGKRKGNRLGGDLLSPDVLLGLLFPAGIMTGTCC